MKVLIHANCFREGLSVAVRRTEPSLEVKTTYNVSADGASTFMKLVENWKPDLLLFQEHKLERAEHFIPGKGFATFVRQARTRIPTISWVHPFNLALWPWATKTAADLIDKGVTNWQACTRLIPEEAARIKAQARNQDDARAAWKAGRLDFNFKARLEATQAHHEANEVKYRPSIILGPWLRENFKKQRLWWNGNHPTGVVYLEVLRNICARTGWKFRPELFETLPGDWTLADGAWPHSAYDHKFFQFSYITEDLARAADCYWRGRLKEIWPV